MSEDPYNRKVLLSTSRKFDLDLHVSELQVEDGTYADLREFIPSLGQYGRGVLIPKAKIREIAKAMLEIADDDGR